jgi:chromosome segregation ATPase
MEAVQEGIDTLASLEERINRAVQVITELRKENEQLHSQLTATQEDLASVKAQADELQGSYTEFEKENGELSQKVKRLSEELETLRGERKQVKMRIEKLLSQLDLLSAS